MAATYRIHYEEHAWIDAHREEFLDQWVALDGGRLLAHGTDARTAMTKLARRAWSRLISYMFCQGLMPTSVDGWANMNRKMKAIYQRGTIIIEDRR
jgi:hypothetical protein